MGWKASCIFILSNEKQDIELVKNTLGFNKMTKVKPEPFEVAINPYEKCYVGYLDNKLIICHPDWSNEIIQGETKVLEKLKNLFPNSKILVIGLQSVINYYAYALYENGILVRKKYGDADEPVREDIGELLPLEKEFINEQIDRIENEDFGKNYYYKGEEEPYTDDSIGEEFVSYVTKEIFTYKLFEMDEYPLFDVELEGFEYGREIKHQSEINSQNDLGKERTSKIKNYIKLTIVIICIFLLRRMSGC